MNKKLTGVLLSLLVLTSCQLEKRHYLPGWSHGSGNAKIQTGQSDVPLMQAEIPFAISDIKPETVIEPDSQIVPAPCEGCDTLYLENGEQIIVEIISMDSTRIKYKHCNSKDDIVYHIKRDKVMSFSTYQETVAPSVVYYEDRITEPIGIIGFIISLLSIPMAFAFYNPELWFLCPIIAIVVCVISLGKQKKNSEKLKGRGWPSAGIAVAFASMLLIGLVFLILAML